MSSFHQNSLCCLNQLRFVSDCFNVNFRWLKQQKQTQENDGKIGHHHLGPATESSTLTSTLLTNISTSSLQVPTTESSSSSITKCTTSISSASIIISNFHLKMKRFLQITGHKQQRQKWRPHRPSLTFAPMLLLKKWHEKTLILSLLSTLLLIGICNQLIMEWWMIIDTSKFAARPSSSSWSNNMKKNESTSNIIIDETKTWPWMTMFDGHHHHNNNVGMIMFVSAQQLAKCGEIKQCSKMFREATLSQNLSYDLSSEKIELICVKLNRAVQCFNNFRKMCINDNFHQSKMTADFFDQMSEGPLGLTMELCNNPKFKQDYLTLGPCQKKYRGEFDRCLTMNQGNDDANGGGDGNADSNGGSQNGSGGNSTILEQFIEHCCALHNYHNCIYDISLEKCGKDAAEFSLKILELFNRGYLRECAKYANLSHLCVRNRFAKASSMSIHWQKNNLNSSSITLSILSFTIALYSSWSLFR